MCVCVCMYMHIHSVCANRASGLRGPLNCARVPPWRPHRAGGLVSGTAALLANPERVLAGHPPSQVERHHHRRVLLAPGDVCADDAQHAGRRGYSVPLRSPPLAAARAPPAGYRLRARARSLSLCGRRRLWIVEARPGRIARMHARDGDRAASGPRRSID